MKAFVSWLIRSLIALFHHSYRFRYQGARDIPRPAGVDGYILAVWHENVFASILAQSGNPHVVIVSRSSDGDIIADLCTSLGHMACRGSSRSGKRDKGGKEAKELMVDHLRSGLAGAVTVDGPRGPRHEVKPGIIDMARQTGLPIIPYAAFPSRCWIFNSWDRFRLPKPFARIDVHYGEPIRVPADTAFDDFSAYQQQVTEGLHALEARRALPRAAPAPAKV